MQSNTVLSLSLSLSSRKDFCNIFCNISLQQGKLKRNTAPAKKNITAFSFWIPLLWFLCSHSHFLSLILGHLLLFFFLSLSHSDPSCALIFSHHTISPLLYQLPRSLCSSHSFLQAPIPLSLSEQHNRTHCNKHNTTQWKTNKKKPQCLYTIIIFNILN